MKITLLETAVDLSTKIVVEVLSVCFKYRAVVSVSLKYNFEIKNIMMIFGCGMGRGSFAFILCHFEAEKKTESPFIS